MNKFSKEQDQWYEIVKYTPNQYHNHIYCGNDWTSISDIVKHPSSHGLSIDEYMEIENRYINTLTQILKASNCHYLTIHHAEIHIKNVRNHIAVSLLNESKSDTLSQILSIEEEQRLSLKDVGRLFRYCLREYIYLEFTNISKGVAVKSGYDYYMYIKTPITYNELRTIVIKNQLYINPR